MKFAYIYLYIYIYFVNMSQQRKIDPRIAMYH